MLAVIIILPLLISLNIFLFGRFLGNRGVALYTTCLTFCSFVASCILGYEFFYLGSSGYLINGISLKLSVFAISYSLVFDSLTCVMLMLVTFVSFLVQVYSCTYMSNDAHLSRFMCFLSLFSFFMGVLVSAENLFQLFIGWEGVGLCSFLLISFWFTRTQANSSAIKAFIINRIGDMSFLIAMFVLTLLCQSLSFFELYLLLDWCSSMNIVFKTSVVDCLNLITLLLFIGAMSKSAQIFLHTWLPDAMEGPTPVSALIHAATMVAAGVFLLSRISFFLIYSEFTSLLVVVIGALTAFFAASVGCFQNDIKKIVAYSTCSQLGYMFVALGLSAFSLSLFHLVTHAFFKALLFLTSGAIIHAVCDNQDIRKLGGLYFLLPLSYVMFFVGSLSLIGFPFFSGFYSKDLIIESVLIKPSKAYHIVFFLLSFSACMTAAYSTKILLLVFLVNTNLQRILLKHVHESGLGLFFPICVLAFFAVFFGFVFFDFFLTFNGTVFQHSFISSLTPSLDAEFLSNFAKQFTFCFSLFGISSAIIIYMFFLTDALFFPYTSDIVFFVAKKWLFDCVNNFFVAYKYFSVAFSVFIKNLDRGLFEIAGPMFVVRALTAISLLPKQWQTGVIYHYLMLFALAISCLVVSAFTFSAKLVFVLTFVFLFLCASNQKNGVVPFSVKIPYKAQVIIATLAGWLHPALFVLYTIAITISFSMYIYRYRIMPVPHWFTK